MNLWRCTTYERISPNFGSNIEYEKIISVILSQLTGHLLYIRHTQTKTIDENKNNEEGFVSLARYLCVSQIGSFPILPTEETEEISFLDDQFY